ncbi:MAG: YraN family protein [Prevotella sp.]|nr:YraN family protein [Prevotella sp.]
MALHNDFGHWGEKVAADYLRRQGYTILHRNYRVGHRDLDIVALRGDVLAFVEVKTRRENSLVDAELAVDGRKIQSVSIAANSYIKRFNINALIRFDVITVVGSPSGAYCINHIEDAFLPIPVYRR